MPKHRPNFWEAEESEYIEVRCVELVRTMHALGLISKDAFLYIDYMRPSTLYYQLWSYK